MAILTDKQFMIAGGVLLGGALLLTWAGKKTVTGIATGNNALTEGTPYEGAGILGTLGAATNELSGGTLQRFGEWLGGKAYELFNQDEIQAAQRVIDGDYEVIQKMNSEGIGE